MADAATQQRPDIVVVDASNFDAYVNEKMGLNPDPEQKAQEEAAKLEGERQANLAKEKAENGETDVEGETEVAEHLPENKRGKINERFRELTAQRKAEKERADKAEAEAKAAREEVERIKREASQQAAKLPELGPEPQLEQFDGRIEAYADALKAWTAEKIQRDTAEKAQREAAAKEAQELARTWNEKQSEIVREVPDYHEVIAANSMELPKEVYEAVKEAIYAADNGPRVLYELSKDQALADRIARMTPAKAALEIGRMDVRLSAPKKVQEIAPEATTKPVAEISKAPAPIARLNGGSAPVSAYKGTDEWPQERSYEEYKRLRAQGKIK